MLTTVDLFAGAGGLSYGFERTGKFRIVAAAEKSPDARKTYKRNHKHVAMFDDVRDIDYSDITKAFGNIDVVIGGPPCQGFSNANRQHSTLISMNNHLVKEYVRAICELKPKVFLMENVAMLRSQLHRFIVEEEDIQNTSVMNLPMRYEKLELLPADISFPNALEIARSISDATAITWPEKRYMAINVLYRYRINEEKFNSSLEKYRKYLSSDLQVLLEQQETEDEITYSERAMAQAILSRLEGKEIDFQSVIDAIKTPLFIQRMVGKLKEIFDNNIHVYDYELSNGAVVALVKSYSVLDYIEGVLSNPPYSYTITPNLYNAADYGAPQKRERFILVGVAPSVSNSFSIPPIEYVEFNYRTVRDAISDLEDVEPFTSLTDTGIPLAHKTELSDLAKELRGSILFNHICTATREVALERFKALKEGQNFHNLDSNLKTTYSNADRTQNTIYMRLVYDSPSGTVVNVRKSMWIHPTLDRAISIREAARLQTFPDHYIFEGSKDSQYQQVGNAVPPILATAIANQILKLLPEQ